MNNWSEDMMADKLWLLVRIPLKWERQPKTEGAIVPPALIRRGRYNIAFARPLPLVRGRKI